MAGVTCRLAKERDLEGIDVSNIVSGDRRARRAAAVTAPISHASIDKSSSSDEAGNSDDEEASSSEEESDDNADQAEGIIGLPNIISGN